MNTSSNTAAPNLCEFELTVLKGIAGVGPGQPWGAALGACLETLCGMGLVERCGGVYQTTPKGQQLAEEK